MNFIKRWIKKKIERGNHNDRDYYCMYWWGDRGGYNYHLERCDICNPKV